VLLAPSKAYQALADTLEPRGQAIAMPTVERYLPSGKPGRIRSIIREMER
jgi:hypothetical protein